MLYAIWDRLMYCLNIPAIQARSTPQGKAMSHDSSWHNPARWCGLVMLTAFLGACSSIPKDGLDIDTSLSAQGKNSRVHDIVSHCTVDETPRSIKILTEQNGTNHYFITDERPPSAYPLV